MVEIQRKEYHSWLVSSRRTNTICLCRWGVTIVFKHSLNGRVAAGGNPCGSSSGSGVGVSAGFAVVLSIVVYYYPNGRQPWGPKRRVQSFVQQIVQPYTGSNQPLELCPVRGSSQSVTVTIRFDTSGGNLQRGWAHGQVNLRCGVTSIRDCGAR